MKVGYARVSTQDQNLDMQIDALKNAGCEVIYSEKISGVKKTNKRKNPEETQLEIALKSLRPGDTFTVWSLDRLGRSTINLIKLILELKEKEVGFEILTQKVDTSSVMGQAFLLFAALFAESEAKLISERTKQALRVRKINGTHWGCKPKLNAKQVKSLYEIFINPERTQSVEEIGVMFGIAPRTVYNYVKPIMEQKKKEETEPTLFSDIPAQSFGDFKLTAKDLEAHK